jgi:hypothetical protein
MFDDKYIKIDDAMIITGMKMQTLWKWAHVDQFLQFKTVGKKNYLLKSQIESFGKIRWIKDTANEFCVSRRSIYNWHEWNYKGFKLNKLPTGQQYIDDKNYKLLKYIVETIPDRNKLTPEELNQRIKEKEDHKKLILIKNLNRILKFRIKTLSKNQERERSCLVHKFCKIIKPRIKQLNKVKTTPRKEVTTNTIMELLNYYLDKDYKNISGIFDLYNPKTIYKFFEYKIGKNMLRFKSLCDYFKNILLQQQEDVNIVKIGMLKHQIDKL